MDDIDIVFAAPSYVGSCDMTVFHYRTTFDLSIMNVLLNATMVLRLTSVRLLAFSASASVYCEMFIVIKQGTLKYRTAGSTEVAC